MGRFGAVTALLLLVAAAAADGGSTAAQTAGGSCECYASTSPVCGQDGNSYQNSCLADCQAVRVLHAGPCSAASGAGVAMLQALESALSTADSRLAAAMAAHNLTPLTVQQLDQVAAAAAGVVEGFDSSSQPARLVTAADMARFQGQGLVLVGVARAVDDFNPRVPSVPEGAAFRPDEPYDNYGATEAVITPDGLLYKPQHLALHAAAVAVATAQVAAEAAAAAVAAAAVADAPQHSGLVAERPHLPGDISASAVLLSGHNTPDDDELTVAELLTANDPTATELDTELDASDSDSDHAYSELFDGDGATDTGSFSLPKALGRRRLHAVFSPDGRMEIASRQRSLLRAVGRVTYDLPDSSYFCTGAMVGRYTVLTAAHCVMSVERQGVTASNWVFSAGQTRRGSDPRYKKAKAVRFHFDTRFWTSGSWWLWDMAVAVLDKGVGSKTGFFGHGFRPAGYIRQPLYTGGYPGDKPLWSFWWQPGNISSCEVTDADSTDTVMLHRCDTAGGQSGSPMWLPDTNTIVAVVSWERDDTNGACAINTFWQRFIRSKRRATPKPRLAVPLP